MAINGKQLKVGMIIQYEGGMYRVMETQIIAPGNWRAFVQTKLRNIITGTQKENRFRTDEMVERAILDQREVEFLYDDGDSFHVMEAKTFEQFSLTKELLGDSAKWLTPNMKLIVESFEGKPITVQLPSLISLKVTQTEPCIKTATATNVYKNAVVETGASVQVPGFINEGDVIDVDPSTGEYAGRSK